MKKEVRPESDGTYVDTKVICACGNEFTVRSTKKELRVEVCSKCHPFYTGSQVSSKQTGNIEKFNRKYGNLKKDK